MDRKWIGGVQEDRRVKAAPACSQIGSHLPELPRTSSDCAAPLRLTKFFAGAGRGDVDAGCLVEEAFRVTAALLPAAGLGGIESKNRNRIETNRIDIKSVNTQSKSNRHNQNIMRPRPHMDPMVFFAGPEVPMCVFRRFPYFLICFYAVWGCLRCQKPWARAHIMTRQIRRPLFCKANVGTRVRRL